MTIKWTRRNRLFAGMVGLAVVLLAVFLVFTFVGMPGGGRLFGTATATETPDGKPMLTLKSDKNGYEPKCIVLRNDYNEPITLSSGKWRYNKASFKYSWSEKGTEVLEPKGHKGDIKGFDYLGDWEVLSDPHPPKVVAIRSRDGDKNPSIGGNEGCAEWGLMMGPGGGGYPD